MTNSNIGKKLPSENFTATRWKQKGALFNNATLAQISCFHVTTSWSLKYCVLINSVSNTAVTGPYGRCCYSISPFPGSRPQCVFIFQTSFVSLNTDIKPKFTWRNLCGETISNWNKTYWEETPTRKYLRELVSYVWNALSANAKLTQLKWLSNFIKC